MSALYEAVDADGHPRTFGCRFGELEDAKRKARKLRGYVVYNKWTAVWFSEAYLARHPQGGGSGGGGPSEQVEPPRSLWANEGAREWAGF